MFSKYILYGLILSMNFICIISQSGYCTKNSDCSDRNNNIGGICMQNQCQCYTGYFGRYCQYGSYSKKLIYLLFFSL